MKSNESIELTLIENQDIFFSNPLNITQIGDPFILKASDGKYYCYPTSDPNDGYKVWVSEDMVHWDKQEKNAYMKPLDGWAKSDFWAPEVYEWDGQYYMYYTARWKENNSLRIGVAVSESPLGPFEDVLNEPMFDFGYAAIDANIFIDEDDQGYLFYSRDCSENIVNGYNESHIYGVKLSDNRLTTIGEPVLLTQPEQQWELDSGNFRWNEGPLVLKRDGIYYLMYSANYYADKKYSLGYATSDQPLGHYTKYDRNPIFHTQSDWNKISGPGHHSVVLSPENNILYAVYHTHSIPAIGGGDRQVNIDSMGFRADGTIFMNGPTIDAQLKPSLRDQVFETMRAANIFVNGEKTDLLSDGEISIYTEGKTKTESILFRAEDVAQIKFDEDEEIQGILLYDEPSNKLNNVKIEFSNGYQISNLEFNSEGPATALFEPMVVDWIKITNNDLDSASGGLSEIMIY